MVTSNPTYGLCPERFAICTSKLDPDYTHKFRLFLSRLEQQGFNLCSASLEVYYILQRYGAITRKYDAALRELRSFTLFPIFFFHIRIIEFQNYC